MFSFFSHTKKGSRSIILDIQSGLVRGALITENDDGSSLISSVVTRSIPSSTRILNGTHLIKRILKLVSEVVTHLVHDSNGVPIIVIHYALSSPWVSTQLKTLKIDYRKETEISSRTLGELIKFESKQQTDADMRPIEQKIFEIKLNGYPTASFESRQAHMLEFSLATSFASGSFIDKLHSTVHNVSTIHKSTYNSALLLQYAALRELLPTKHEYIYIHIHSELTDIVIVKNGLCRHVASFPFGISTLLRKIANSTRQSIESSDSILSLFQGNKLSEAEKVSTMKIIEPLLNEWSDMCIKSFVAAFDMTSIPRTAYLSAHSHFDLFKNALNSRKSINLDIVTYDAIHSDNHVSFGVGSVQSTMMKMYTLAIRTVL